MRRRRRKNARNGRRGARGACGNLFIVLLFCCCERGLSILRDEVGRDVAFFVPTELLTFAFCFVSESIPK